MPLTASDLIARRKGLVLSYDAYNNQRPTNPQSFTTYTETYDALAAGQKIAVNQQPTGSYVCSIPITAFQQMCASHGSSPTLSELVRATNIQSVTEQAPAEGLNVVVLGAGGIAVYCPNGTFLGAVNAAGNPIPEPVPPAQGYPWTARYDGVGNGFGYSWNSITYGAGLYVAVSSDGTNRVMTSPDGITWTPQTAAVNNDWISVTYGAGLFVAVSITGLNRIMTAP